MADTVSSVPPAGSSWPAPAVRNPHTQACCRIFCHDARLIDTSYTQQKIAHNVWIAMIDQLIRACYSPIFDHGGLGDTSQTGPTRLVLWKEGAALLQQFPSLSLQEQLKALRWDLLVRDKILFQDREALYFLNNPHLQPASTPVSAPRPDASHKLARELRAQINREEFACLETYERRLLELIEQQSQQQQILPPVPPNCMSPNAAAGEGYQVNFTLPPATLAPGRPALAPLPANHIVTPRLFNEPSGTFKRKRDTPAQKSSSEVISLPEDSDDEDSLQSQVDSLNAKIAAIRARTEQEDHLAPNRQPKKKFKTVKDFGSQAQSMPHVAGTIPAISSQRPLAPSSTIPPKGSDSGHKLFRQVQPGVVPKFQPRVGTATSSEPKPAASAQKKSLPTDRVRLTIYSQGRANLKVKPEPHTLCSQIMAAARQVMEIPAGLHTNLSWHGRFVGLGKSVAEAGFRDLDRVDLIIEKFTAEKPTSGNAFANIPPSSQAKAKVEPAKASSVMPFQSQQERLIDLTSDSAPQIQPTVKPPEAPLDGPVLCEEQQQVVDLIMAGKNVFYTGSAGCGKSTVLKAFVPKLREQGKVVRIVAPTGKAALDINGSTTWTFAGWTPASMKKPLKFLEKAAHGKFVRRRLVGTDVLVIDEISMVENHMLERLNAIMKEARGSTAAFGGVQLIVTGDFCQLPPVKPFEYCMVCGRHAPRRIGAQGRTVHKCPMHGECNDDDKWAFRSRAWEECNFQHVNLTSIHRQSDEVFIKILQKLRIGTPLTNADRQLLLNHPCDVTNAVKLFPTREEVRRINQAEFDKLTTSKLGYTCLDFFFWNKEKHPHLESKGIRNNFDDSLEALREHRLDSLVEYKEGMLVVLLVNLDIAAGLVNGSQGRVVGFERHDPAKLPKARQREGGGGSRPSQSKSTSRYGSSQGGRRGRERSVEREAPAPAVEGELRGEYAALREGQICEFMNRSRNKSKMWPIVEFDNRVKRTIYADCQVNELGDEKEYTLLARTQIPLIAAWAMTIHKSQGMTLNRVIVDLGRSFEEGQEYVALSRARSLDGLKVLALGDGVGKGGNAQVREFLWQRFKLR